MNGKAKRLFGLAAFAAVITIMTACNNPAGGDTTPDNNNNNQPQTCSHVWGEWTPEASCVALEQTRTCTVPGCTATQTRTAAALGHLAPGGYAPTCTTDGNTGTGACKRCGEHVAGDVIPALGHDYSNPAATCITPKLCARDNCYHELEAALGHDYSNPAATCTTPKLCARDGCYHELEAELGHDLSGVWTVQTPATCTTAGKERRTCQRDNCNHFVSQVIPALGGEHSLYWERTRFFPYQETSKICSICRRTVETFTPGSEHVQVSLIVPGAYRNKEMVRIPAGNIKGIPHITQNHDFWISRYKVTRAQWRAVPGMAVPSQWGAGNGNLPATHVNWFDAIEFANRLSIARYLTPVYSIPAAAGGAMTTNPDLWGSAPTSGSGPVWDRWIQVQMSTTANGYRLPTSAQWEYAARAGTTTEFNDGITDGWSTQQELDAIDYLAWTNNNSGGQVQEVGQLRPNAWGLYDMHGNLWEFCWCADGIFRTLRGGSWSAIAEDARSSRYISGSKWTRANPRGIRLVRH